MYAVFCDHCGKQFMDEIGTGFCAYTDKVDAVEASMQDGWAVLHAGISVLTAITSMMRPMSMSRTISLRRRISYEAI